MNTTAEQRRARRHKRFRRTVNKDIRGLLFLLKEELYSMQGQENEHTKLIERRIIQLFRQQLLDTKRALLPFVAAGFMESDENHPIAFEPWMINVASNVHRRAKIWERELR